MQKWEYKTLRIAWKLHKNGIYIEYVTGGSVIKSTEHKGKELDTYLDELGGQGWELVAIWQVSAVETNGYTFKRPKP